MAISRTGIIIPDNQKRLQIEDLSGQKLSVCYQCTRCTSGCPLAFAMDIMPHQIIRLLYLGQVEKAASSQTVWMCASCETCSTRCPNGVDIAHIMDTLRQINWSRNADSIRPEDKVFHTEFLNSIKQYGRVAELRMITNYTAKTTGITGLLKQGTLGLKMILGGKLKLLPETIRNRKQVRKLFQSDGKGPKK